MAKHPRKFYCLATDRDLGRHHLDKDQLAIMLTNTAPDPKWETPADMPEIEAGNGYPKGGVDLANQVFTSVNGATKVTASQVSIKADGGLIGPYRWIILFNKTAQRLMGYWDFGCEDVIVPGEFLTLPFGPNGVFSGM